jgi:hypothetical protein
MRRPIAFSSYQRPAPASAERPIHRLFLFLPTRGRPYGGGVTEYEVRLKDGTTEVIEGADAYRPDGQLTSFFAFGDGRSTIDSWSIRVASIRTTAIVAVRRRPPSSRMEERAA